MYGAHISHYSAPHAWAREARTDLVDGQSLARYRERFYSTLAPPEPYATDLRLCVPRCDFGPQPSAMRPCAPGSGAVESTDGHGRQGWERLHRPSAQFLASELAF